MAVPATMADLSTSEASNSPADSDSITATTRPSDYLRAHAAILRTLAASDTIAAGATVDLSTKANTFITLTGAATTISALGTVAAGVYKWIIYNAAHTLTYNGTSLILLGGVDRTVAAGDASLFVSEGSGNWRELTFADASGFQPLDATLTALAGVLTAANKIPYATALNTAGELDFKDEDDMASNSATALPSQQSVKAYVDTEIAAASTITIGTAVASTSGTAIDYTSIPATAKKITVNLSDVSTNGTSVHIIQLGDSGGVETTGYTAGGGVIVVGSASVSGSTSGFSWTSSGAASDAWSGSVTLSLLDASTNTWVASGALYRAGDVGIGLCGGTKSLTGTLDRIRITTVNGTDAFDTGTVNILYE